MAQSDSQKSMFSALNNLLTMLQIFLTAQWLEKNVSDFPPPLNFTATPIYDFLMLWRENYLHVALYNMLTMMLQGLGERGVKKGRTTWQHNWHTIMISCKLSTILCVYIYTWTHHYCTFPPLSIDQICSTWCQLYMWCKSENNIMVKWPHFHYAFDDSYSVPATMAHFNNKLLHKQFHLLHFRRRALHVVYIYIKTEVNVSVEKPFCSITVMRLLYTLPAGTKTKSQK